MKPKIFLAAKILIALVIGSVVFCLFWSKQYSELPYKNNMDFQRIFYSTSDGNYIYWVDQYKKRIVKTTKGEEKNKVEKVINLNNGNQTFSSIAVENNKIYAVRNTEYSNGETREEIVQYSDDGENIICDSKKLDFEGNISFISLKGDNLSFITCIINEVNRVEMVKHYKTFISKKTTYPIYEMNIPESIHINKIIGLDRNSFYFTGKNGEINEAAITSSGFKSIYPLENDKDTKSNPVFLDFFGNGIVFADEAKREISLLENNRVRVLLSEERFIEYLEKNRKDIKNLIVQSVDTVDDNTIICTISDYVVSIKVDPNGHNDVLEIYSNYAMYKPVEMVKRVFIWAFVVILFILLINAFLIFYNRCIRTKIKRKQSFIFILIIGISFVFVMFIVKLSLERVLTDRIHKQLASKAGAVVNQINREDSEKSRNDSEKNENDSENIPSFVKIKSTSDFDEDAYKNVKKLLCDVQESPLEKELYANKLESCAGFMDWFMPLPSQRDGYYSILYKLEKVKNKENKDEFIFNICVTEDDDKSPFHPYFIPDDKDNIVYNKAAKEPQFLDNQKDETGEFVVLLTPIRDESEKLLGVYEIGVNRSIMTGYINSFLIRIGLLIFVVLLICVALIIIVISRIILKPLTELQKGVLKLDGETWDNELHINTGDELEDISHSFNNMNIRLKERITQIEQIRRAYARFFPNQIKNYLHKDNIVDICRRNHTSNEMGVLMTNICSYYSYSKEMTDDERFDFFDEYINNIGPAIYREGGFISKFTGGGIMALFPKGKAADRLMVAALAVQKSISQYNADRTSTGNPAFQIGLGLHISKSVLLGIVGFESKSENINRLEVAVMDEEVVLTEAMQNAAKELGASILATDAIIGNLEITSQYKYRYLGLVLFENIQQRTKIYDVYHGDDEELKALKEETKNQFEEGILLYQKREFKKAKDIFIDIISVNDRDLAAKIYYFLCDEYGNMEKLPKNWDRQISIRGV